MKIVVDKNIPFLKGIVEEYGEVTYLEGNSFSADKIKDADTLIIRTVTRFDKSLLESSKVKLICSATIGYDHIDTNYCAKHGIAWTNAPGCNSGSVQQYIASALVTLSYKKNIKLSELTIGIIGVGHVGKKVADLCQLLGMRILLNDPPRQELEGDRGFVDMETIKREADVITFHTPLEKDGNYPTYHLADPEFFSTLVRKPVIINAARGSIVDTRAIKHAISNKLISGAIIDCWENEPNIDQEYMRMVDIATPHIAGYSADGKANASRLSLQALARFWNLSEEPIGKIIVPEIEDHIIDFNSLRGNKVYDALLYTYAIETDTEKLLKQPAEFSQWRSNYPVRREYPAYAINQVKNPEDIELLKKLGFSVVIGS